MNSKSKASEILSIHRVNSKHDGLYVESWSSGDRYHHAIGLIIDGRKVRMLESCEGGSDQPWPPSPPLQQVYKQNIGSDPAILGVGMAGKSHFSTSFLLQENETIDLIVESACLMKDMQNAVAKETASLGTTYLADPSVRFTVSNEHNTVTIHHADLPKLQLLTECCLESIGDTNGFRVYPDELDQDKATQWSYQIRLFTK